MITASHNPKEDNGYKLYLDNATQIIPPHDALIADLIVKNLEPMPGVWDESLVGSALCSDPVEEVEEAYFSSLDKWRIGNEVKGSKLKICYTAMHGVGYPFARKVFERFNLPEFVSVVTQVRLRCCF